MELKLKDTITSLELLEKINYFRDKEGKSEQKHNDLLKVIRNEFEEEIGQGKISQSSYKNSQNKTQPMFALTLSQAKQVLVRESRTVRRAVIKYIEKMEQALIELNRNFREDIQLETVYGDQYLDKVHATLKRCRDIEAYIEKLYTEELKPMYEHCQALLGSKAATMMTGHFYMKYGANQMIE